MTSSLWACAPLRRPQGSIGSALDADERAGPAHDSWPRLDAADGVRRRFGVPVFGAQPRILAHREGNTVDGQRYACSKRIASARLQLTASKVTSIGWPVTWSCSVPGPSAANSLSTNVFLGGRSLLAMAA